MFYLYVIILLVLALAIAMLTVSSNVRLPSVQLFHDKGKSKKKLHPLRLPTLSQYARDLTMLAGRGELDPVVGRDREIRRVIQILSRRTKNNPILIGKAGVGKTAVVEGLAQTLLSNIWQSSLSSKRVLSLDISSLLAGTKFRGEFEKRLKRVANEIIAAQRSIILFIDEIHTLAGAGEATGGIGAADILKPALARGDLQVVGATTPNEYNEKIKQDSTLARRFQPVLIKEPNMQETINILSALKPRYSSYHEVIISNDAIVRAVELSIKYIKGRHLPDKAIDVMDEAASLVKLNARIHPSPKDKLPEVTPADIEKVVKEWAKINT